tara:strand:+ start:141 stop:1163 length:1023 start_codon:yes stop_codon:yes gene_type:complete
MQMKDYSQVVKSLRNSFNAYDFKQAINWSKNEAQTREMLIEPVLQWLGYDKFSHWITEADGGLSSRIDYALNPFGKEKGVLIVIEAKKYGKPLNNNDVKQMREYFNRIRSSQFGILTNGEEWQFYAAEGNTDYLSESPFYVMNVLDMESIDFENLARFHVQKIDPKELLEEALKISEAASFDEALYSLLAKPSESLIKEVILTMGHKRSTAQRIEFVKERINYFSIKEVAERLLREGVNPNGSGVVTTELEKQVYQVVKTIVGVSSKQMSTQAERLTSRDSQGQYAVLFDDNSRQPICTFKLDGNKKYMRVGKELFIELMSIDDIINHKSDIINEVKKYL